MFATRRWDFPPSLRLRGTLDDMADNGPKRTVRTHGSSGYRAGCRCATCTLAESERKRNWRATGRSNLVQFPTRAKGAALVSRPTQQLCGEVEASVLAEWASVAGAEEKRAALAMARSVARILDNPQFAGMHVQAARQLSQILESLHDSGSHGRGGRRKSGGRLAAVADLAKARRSR